MDRRSIQGSAGRRRAAVAVLAALTFAVVGPSSAAGASGHLGTVDLNGRLDGPAEFMAQGPDSRTYTFDVARNGGRLRVSLDLSNRDDCVLLQLWDPKGHEVNPVWYDWPFVCPPDQPGQTFDVELSVPRAAVGRWQATVSGRDVIDLSLRLRVTLTDAPKSKPSKATYLYPDLVPWLPWEFGFAAPASAHPGTANDRDNQPGDPTVSCHTEEAPDDQCLRFSAGIYNIGDGPMYVAFRNDVAYQHVYLKDSTPLDYYDNETRGKFIEMEAGFGEWHEFHEHRHLGEMVLYELFKVTDASGTLSPVDTGHKHGYCTFSQQIGDWGSTAQDPQYSSYPAGVFCGDAMTLERGWGDIYRWQRPGQFVSYAGVAEADGSMQAGRYVLRFTVDPEDHIAETNDANNVGYALIDVEDGGGLGHDTITVCHQGLGSDPWDAAAEVVPDRFGVGQGRSRSWIRRADLRLRDIGDVRRIREDTRAARAVIGFLLGIAGLAFCIALLWLGMRAVMDLGGFCASGGPYVIAVECPDAVLATTPLSIFGAFLAIGLILWGGAALGGSWIEPRLPGLAGAVPVARLELPRVRASSHPAATAGSGAGCSAACCSC